jgi:predicted TIM-barrel fold metal-dependent hydrolase
MTLVDMAASFAGDEDRTTEEIERARFRAGATIGITMHVACTLFPAVARPPAALRDLNDARDALARRHPRHIAWFAATDPSDVIGALEELTRCVALGAIGVDWHAATEEVAPTSAPIAMLAARGRLLMRSPSAAVLADLARRLPSASFLLAQLGDGGDWPAALDRVAPFGNVLVDVSGGVAERGMLDAVITRVGAARVLWGTGRAMEAGLAQLRALEVIAPGFNATQAIRWRNAVSLLGGARSESRALRA